MKGYSIFISILILLPIISAQYWFQSGARGGSPTQFNSGAIATIETVVGQQIQSGSAAYWVGEDIQNGAFLQIGYVIENQSGRYPSYCDQSGCSQYEYISAGAPEWFYEYFPPGQNSDFFGGIGSNDSAGKNGALHSYGFYANGTTWYFTFDGNVVGDINLDSNTSGYNDVVAFGELANTSNSSTRLLPVRFYNLSIFRFGRYTPSPTGYSYIGYGIGSMKILQNPYGVQELGSRADSFEVGSGLPQPTDGSTLWQNSYTLSVASKYGNLSSASGYIGSSTASISEPHYVYINNNTRAVFTGWSGNGAGSYSGPGNSSAVVMYSNITETANWQLQYYVNVSSAYSASHGAGWYPANSTAYYYVTQNVVYSNTTSRAVFAGWSNTNPAMNGSTIVSGPASLSALWTYQYYVNASSQYGNSTGSGWYPANSLAYVSVLSLYQNSSAEERLAFYSWNDGNTSASRSLLVDRPYSMYASYMPQFLVNLEGIDEYGNPVDVQAFYVSNSSPGTQLYLFGGHAYVIEGALYKGTNVSVDQPITINASGTVPVHLPLYDVNVSASDVFGVPVEVPVTIILSNGTQRNVLVNKNSSSTVTVVQDIPYGRATASTQYLGLQLSSQVQYGQTAKLTVVSTTDIGVFAAVIIAAFIMYYIASKHVLNVNPRRHSNQ